MVEALQVEDALVQAGFEPHERADISRAWGDFNTIPGVINDILPGYIQERRQANIRSSLRAIDELITISPQLPHSIYHDFGIRHFGRYKTGTIYGQYHEFNSSEVPTNLVISAVEDWKGSLQRVEGAFQPLTPVYMEAGTCREVWGAITKTRKYFGPIKNLIIFSHGGKDTLSLSAENPILSAMVTGSEELSRIRSKGVFRPDARIVLAACNTGVEGGIAQQISRVTGMTVIAPEAVTDGHIEYDPKDPQRRVVKFPNTGDFLNIFIKVLQERGHNLGSEITYRERNTAVVYEAGRVVLGGEASLVA